MSCVILGESNGPQFRVPYHQPSPYGQHALSTCSLAKLSSPLYHDSVLRALHHGITLTQLLGVGREFGSEPRSALLYSAVCQTLDCQAVPGFTSGLVSDMLASIWYCQKDGTTSNQKHKEDQEIAAAVAGG